MGSIRHGGSATDSWNALTKLHENPTNCSKKNKKSKSNYEAAYRYAQVTMQNKKALETLKSLIKERITEDEKITEVLVKICEEYLLNGDRNTSNDALKVYLYDELIPNAKIDTTLVYCLFEDIYKSTIERTESAKRNVERIEAMPVIDNHNAKMLPYYKKRWEGFIKNIKAIEPNFTDWRSVVESLDLLAPIKEAAKKEFLTLREIEKIGNIITENATLATCRRPKGWQ